MTTESATRLRGAIFDLGGVMTEPLGRHREQIVDPRQLAVLRFFLDDFQEVYHLPTGLHDLHLLETGAISDEEFFDRMADRYVAAGGEPFDGRTAQRVVFGRGLVACAAMVDAVRQVKAGGYRTALLTNISRSGEALWRSLLPIEELFDVVVDSSQVGLRKPDPAIFRLTCGRLGLEPGECLFVDDLHCNVSSAEALGMRVIHCQDPVAVANQVTQMLLGHPAGVESASAAPPRG